MTNWKRTRLQSLVLGLVVGPIVWAFLSDTHSIGDLLYSMSCMAIAPFLVDGLHSCGDFLVGERPPKAKPKDVA